MTAQSTLRNKTKPKDKVWVHVITVEADSGKITAWKCKYCKVEKRGSIVGRIKDHLSKCKEVKYAAWPSVWRRHR